MNDFVILSCSLLYWFFTGLNFFWSEPPGVLKNIGFGFFCIIIMLSTSCLISSGYPIIVLSLLFYANLCIVSLYDFVEYSIPRFCSIFFIPLNLLCCYYKILPISLTESIATTLISSGIFFLIARRFKNSSNNDGMGVGDIELVAMISSFVGAENISLIILLASLLGLLFHCITRTTIVPFGSALAIATGYINLTIFLTR